MRAHAFLLAALCLIAACHDVAAAKKEKDVTKLQIGVKVRCRSPVPVQNVDNPASTGNMHGNCTQESWWAYQPHALCSAIHPCA
jgi:hypothetical protein